MTFLKAFLGAAVIAASFAGTIHFLDKATDPVAGSTVRLVPADDVCSGVHIGNGYIVTAEHCITTLKEVSFETDEGKKRYTADVLWTNVGFDIALLKARVSHMQATEIVCRNPIRGEAITAHGNPFGMRFFVASGTVAIAAEDQASRWKSIFVVSVPVAGGMSGGPILDSAGRLLGITVATVGSAGPFGLAVPVQTVCALLARS